MTDKYIQSTFIDLEVTNLPHSVQARNTLLSHEELIKNFKYVEIYQAGIYKEGIDKFVKHYSTTPTSRVAARFLKGSQHKRTYKLGGESTEVITGLVKRVTKEQELEFLEKNLSELHRFKVSGFKTADRKDVLNIIEKDGKRVLASEFSTIALLDSGELDEKKVVDAVTKTAKTIKEHYTGKVQYKGLTNKEFFNSKSEGSLFSILNDLLAPVRSGNISKLVGWNPYFDLNNLRAAALRYGHTSLLMELDKAYANGSLVVEGAEKYWQALIFKLAEENPELAEKFKIFSNIEAFVATGGRVGRKPVTWVEYQHATFWSANSSSKLLSWDKRILDALPLGEEIHAGGADTYLEKEMYQVMKDIFNDVKGELAKSGINIEHIDDLINLKNTNGIVGQVLNAKIMEGATKLGGASKINNLKDFEKEVETILSRSNRNISTAPLQAVGNTLIKKNKKLIRSFNEKDLINFAKKNATLVGGALLVAAGLYSVGSDKEDSVYPFYGSLKANLRRKTSLASKSYNLKFEDTANNNWQILGTLTSAFAAPVLGLYSIGALSAYTDPKLFGRKTFATPKSFQEAAYQFGRTVRYGARKLEASVPLFRTFRLTPVIDSLFGVQTILNYSPEKLNGRAIVVNTIKDAKKVGKFKHHTYVDPLLYEAQEYVRSGKLSQDNLDLLSEALQPSEVPQGVKNRVVRLSHKEGKTLVTFEDTTINGVKVGINSVKSIELPFIVDAPFTRDTNVKNVGLLHRRAERFFARQAGYEPTQRVGSIANPMVHFKEQETLIKSGIARKKTFEEYLTSVEESMRKSGQKIPNNDFGGLWRLWQRTKWMLDLDAKGVGESANNLFTEMSEHTRPIERILHIRSGRNLKYSLHEYMIGGMNTFWENPLNLLFADQNKAGEYANKWLASSNRLTRIAGRGAKLLEGLHLGLPYYNMNYLSSIPIINKIPGHKALEYFAHFGAKRILPAFLAYEGIRALDHIWGAATFSPTGRSPLTNIPIKAYEYATLAYSKISDLTGFTSLSKAQERIAPGSTSFGIFAPALSMTTMYIAGELAYKYGPSSLRRTISAQTERFMSNQYVRGAIAQNRILTTASRQAPMQRYFNWALKNPKSAIFSFMMLPMLPFVPGFLGSSKSYRERKAEYEGKKEVAIRKYRGWLLSSSAYEGGKPVQFRRHALNLLKSDWENRGVVWPSYWQRLLHNASFGTLNRYALEEYHAKDQPVYQSSAYGANIPLVGPIIAGTIGRLIKPTVTYHEPGESPYSTLNLQGPYSVTGNVDRDTLSLNAKLVSDSNQLAMNLGLQSESSVGQLHARMSKQFRDMIGFRGFLYEATRGELLGKKSADMYTPYAQDATEMYNPAQSMWSYALGDITVIGGEALRRIFPMPNKLWKVNDIPNELSGISWIPQGVTTGSPRDLTHGTTFDKVPMGWLYGSRKGWEFLYPEVKGLEMEEYPDPIRLEILQSIAPFSREFNITASQVLDMAIGNSLSPEEEQRYYETMDQVRQLKDQVYAHSSEYTYQVSTHASKGIVTSLSPNGGFTLDSYGNRTLRLAGVSLDIADIRAELLNKQRFNTAQELDKEARRIQIEAQNMVSQYLSPGSNVKVEIPDMDQMIDARAGTEAIVGDLNERLMEIGVPFSDTGNLSRFNMAQDRAGIGSSAMAKYWDAITDGTTFWGQKLIPKQDYLDQYLYKQVFNREVKLWNHPIEHLLKPALATLMHKFGSDRIPDFTVDRRKHQEYWDVIKYIKYKSLAVQASQEGNDELASYYHSKWRATMIGSNPTDDDTMDEMVALPSNERAYYTRFASEPDPKKRGKIFKYLPHAAKRIYEATWMRKEAEASDDPEVQERWSRLVASEGFDVTDDEYKMYQKEAPEGTSLADWIRTRYIQAYAKKNPIPDSSWIGWGADTDIENVELLALREGGENIEDFGFFDNRARLAAFDQGAMIAAVQINSLHYTGNQTLGTILPLIAANDYVQDGQGAPTTSLTPTMNINVQTNGYQREVARDHYTALSLADDALNVLSSSFI